MALCVEIADAMVALIGAQTFDLPFTVERDWTETQRLEIIQEEDPVKVIVVPRVLNTTARDLTPRIDYAWDIGVWIDKKVQQTNAACDPVADFVEQVITLLNNNRQLTITSEPHLAQFIGITPDPTYDTTQLLDIRVFRSVFLATYRVTR
jgi:hypothetical protein